MSLDAGSPFKPSKPTKSSTPYPHARGVLSNSAGLDNGKKVGGSTRSTATFGVTDVFSPSSEPVTEGTEGNSSATPGTAKSTDLLVSPDPLQSGRTRTVTVSVSGHGDQKSKTPHSSGSEIRGAKVGSSSSSRHRVNGHGKAKTPSSVRSSKRTPKAFFSPSEGRGDVMTASNATALHSALTEVASTTASQLEEIWDEVGYSTEERAGQLEELLDQLRQLFDSKVAEERSVSEQFRKSIADAREELRLTSRALRTDFDVSLLEDRPGQNLTEQLAELEAALEGIRERSEEASAHLCTCRDKLLEMHAALGTDMPRQWMDVESDLTQKRRDAFDSQVAHVAEMLETRTSAIVQILVDCQRLLKELRFDVDAEDLDRQILDSLVLDEKDEKTLRSVTENDSCTGIHSDMLERLTSRLEVLNAEKKRRKMKLAEMGGEIANLWEKLRVSDEEQRAFTKSVRGLGMDTIEKGKLELQRLLQLKAERIGNLILDARRTIQELWEETSTGQEQRDSFAAAQVDDESQFTDDLLAEHDAYIQLLQDRLEKMKPVLKMIERREEIIVERMQYEEFQKDSDRLKQRGAKLTKQLMMEEKMARRIKKDLPKLTEMLEKRLGEWHQENGVHFVINGEAYLDVMQRQEEEWRSYKDVEAKHKLRKRQQEQRAATENRSSSIAPALPGRKKTISVGSHKGESRPLQPLSNAQSRENSRKARFPSRGRQRPRPIGGS